jgi:membrane protein implicated in regulation of membrane protease activity
MSSGVAKPIRSLDMTVLRLAAAGIVALVALGLATASVVAFYAGGYVLQAALYALVSLALVRVAARLRRRRRRAVGYLPLRLNSQL